MPNSLIYKPMGGGYRPHPDIIKIKVKEYRRRKHLDPNRYTVTERRITAYVLAQHFEFTPRDIADFFHCDPRTAQNDIRLMSLHYRIYPLLAQKCLDLYDYIIYNARYIH